MSYTEYHSGRLRKIPMKMDDSLEEQCRRITIENSPDLVVDIYKSYDSFETYMRDECHEEYLILNGEIYEILEHMQSDEDMFNVWKNEDGTISFAGSFYNGGTYLVEMIEDGLKAIK